MDSDALIDFSVIAPSFSTDGSRPKVPDPLPDSQKTALWLEAAGELRLRYFHKEPGLWNVAGSVRITKYTLNGQTPNFSYHRYL